MARDVTGCIELMRALAPGLSLPAAGELRVGVAWADRSTPLVRERLLAAAAAFDAWAPVDFPIAEAVGPAFMREVGDVHRELYPENAELYGENIRSKIERCIDVTDARVRRGAAGAERADRARAARRSPASTCC